MGYYDQFQFVQWGVSHPSRNWTYEDVRKFMGKESWKKLKNRRGVEIETDGDAFQLSYYNTKVITWYPDGTIQLSHGGHATRMTTVRMNEFTSAHTGAIKKGKKDPTQPRQKTYNVWPSDLEESLGLEPNVYTVTLPLASFEELYVTNKRNSSQPFRSIQFYNRHTFVDSKGNPLLDRIFYDLSWDSFGESQKYLRNEKMLPLEKALPLDMSQLVRHAPRPNPFCDSHGNALENIHLLLVSRSSYHNWPSFVVYNDKRRSDRIWTCRMRRHETELPVPHLNLQQTIDWFYEREPAVRYVKDLLVFEELSMHRMTWEGPWEDDQIPDELLPDRTWRGWPSLDFLGDRSEEIEWTKGSRPLVEEHVGNLAIRRMHWLVPYLDNTSRLYSMPRAPLPPFPGYKPWPGPELGICMWFELVDGSALGIQVRGRKASLVWNKPTRKRRGQGESILSFLLASTALLL